MTFISTYSLVVTFISYTFLSTPEHCCSLFDPRLIYPFAPPPPPLFFSQDKHVAMVESFVSAKLLEDGAEGAEDLEDGAP